MKWLGFIFVGLASYAHASFELALVADNGTGGSSARVIHRFDAATGIYLGNFGGFASSISNMAIHAPTRTLAVASGGNIIVFDYNTGLRLRTFTSFSNSKLAISADGSSLFQITIPGINQFRLSDGALLSTIAHAGTSFSSVGVDPVTGNIVGFAEVSSTVGQAVVYTGSGSLVGSSTFSTSAVTAVRNVGFFGGQSASWAFQTANHSFVVRNLNYSNGSSAASLSSSFVTGTTILGIAPTHTGSLFLTTSATGAASVDAFDRTGFYRNFGSAQLVNPVAIATVVAPEPATLMALAFPAWVLARRRKQ